MDIKRIQSNDPTAYGARANDQKAHQAPENKDAEAASAANNVAPVANQVQPANQLQTDQIVTGPKESSGPSGAADLLKGLQQNYGANAGQDSTTREAAAA
ncbi:MAG: hypothetical protein KC910_31495 [Candidatus Eremiobacteraeota bacterium]|nr:hypothetical protein [Candidatus Eremiobacteraeota bacterium]